jgi:hypothetical protein
MKLKPSSAVSTDNYVIVYEDSVSDKSGEAIRLHKHDNWLGGVSFHSTATAMCDVVAT